MKVGVLLPTLSGYERDDHLDRSVERVGELMELGIREFNLILPREERGRAVLERVLGEVRP